MYTQLNTSTPVRPIWTGYIPTCQSP